MRKIMFLAAGLMLLAGACNRSVEPTVYNNPIPKPATAGAKVDAAVNALSASVDSEDTINLQSDDDLMNDDQEIINGYSGVSNANF